MANGDVTAGVAVLVSLRPRFATAIAAGTKRVELRRRFPAVAAGTCIVFYSTLPVGAVVGAATIARVEQLPLEELWLRHQGAVSLTRPEFDAYFDGLDFGFAVVLSDYRSASAPLSLAGMRLLGLRAPQSVVYVAQRDVGRLLGEPPIRA